VGEEGGEREGSRDGVTVAVGSERSGAVVVMVGSWASAICSICTYITSSAKEAGVVNEKMFSCGRLEWLGVAQREAREEVGRGGKLFLGWRENGLVWSIVPKNFEIGENPRKTLFCQRSDTVDGVFQPRLPVLILLGNAGLSGCD